MCIISFSILSDYQEEDDMGILLTAEEEAAQAGSVTSILLTVVIYALFIGVLWFIMFRPQKKEQKKVAAMIAALEVGDCVLTTSGFYGVVIDITDDMVIVEFGSNKNCRIPMEKTAISKVEKAGEN